MIVLRVVLMRFVGVDNLIRGGNMGVIHFLWLGFSWVYLMSFKVYDKILVVFKFFYQLMILLY